MTTAYQGQLSLKDIAELAGVGRPAVSNWRARNENFPSPVEDSPPRRPLFHFDEIVGWLEKEGLLPDDWKTKATNVLVSAAINPLTTNSGDNTGAAKVALAVLAAHKNASENRNDFLPDVSDIRASLEQFLESLVPNIISSAQLEAIGESITSIPTEALVTLVHGLARINDDSYGTAAQMIVEVLFGNAGRSVFGQHTTSTAALTLMINAASTTTVAGATVFDPTCGLSGVLLGVGSRVDDSTVIGNDLNPDSVSISMLRAYLDGVEASFTVSDLLVNDPQPGLQADTIVSEPPFSLRLGSEQFESVAESVNALLGVKIPPTVAGDVAFLTYPISHLSSEGRAYVLTAPSLCYHPRLDEFRQKLVARGMVEAIVQLPQKLLTTTSIATTLWVLRSPDQSGNPAPVLLADASNAESPEEHIAEWLTAMRHGKTTTIPTGSLLLAEMVTTGSNLLPSQVLAQAPSSDELLDDFNDAWDDLSTTADSIKAVLPTGKPEAGEIPTAASTESITKIESIARVSTRSWANDEKRPENTISAQLATRRKTKNPVEVFIKTDAQTLLPGDIIALPMAPAPAWVFGNEEGKWVAPPHAFVLRVKDDSFLPAYLVACINAPFNAYDDGTRIPRRRLSEIKIPLLDIAEQKKVVDVIEPLQQLSQQAEQLAAQSEAATSAVANLIYFGADI